MVFWQRYSRKEKKSDHILFGGGRGVEKRQKKEEKKPTLPAQQGKRLFKAEESRRSAGKGDLPEIIARKSCCTHWEKGTPRGKDKRLMTFMERSSLKRVRSEENHPYRKTGTLHKLSIKGNQILPRRGTRGEAVIF